jgi:hypothetical protein
VEAIEGKTHGYTWSSPTRAKLNDAINKAKQRLILPDNDGRDL